ncbi:AMP-binding protein, partial [Pelagibacteraceae bacterium]|nr:AMP-binding protein [Pelagibacteraceae bacterium]
MKNYRHEYMMVDENKKYKKKEIIEKIFSYQRQLNKIWKNSKNRGIAILLERDVEYICLIFATWLSKGFYLPFSHETPRENIKLQLEDSNINFIAERKNNKIQFKNLKNKKINELIKKNHRNISYIIFTSGSTGDKKGVCISNTAFTSYLASIKKKFKSKRKPKSLIISGELTFDITIADLAFVLVFGSQIIITNKSQNFISLLSMIKENKAESMYLVPSGLNKVLDFSKKIKINYLKSIKQINIGGEIFSVNLLNKIKKFFKNIIVYNFYGPTEFTINSMCHEVNIKKNYKEIPIGKPLNGITTLVNNGELYLNGKQRMQGYVNSKDPFITIKNKKYYPTGDMVELN